MDGKQQEADYDCCVPEGHQRLSLDCVSPTVTDKQLFPATEHLSWHPNPYPSDFCKVSVQDKHKTHEQYNS